MTSSLAGVWLHIALDAPLYEDMTFFYPLPGNPFLGLVDDPIIYSLCFFSGLAGVAMYVLYLRGGTSGV